MATKTCNSWNKDVIDAWLAGKTLKLALFTSTAALSETTTTYSTTNECSSTAGTDPYVAGGKALTSVSSASITGGAKVTAANASWTNITIAGVRYAMVYDSATNKAVSVHDFGSDQSASAAAFTVTVDATNGIAKITTA